MITRRIFVRDGALAVVGMGVVPPFLCRAALAADPAHGKKKVLVTVFLRGAADGVNMVVPFGEKAYYRHRPSIAIPAPVRNKPSVLDLDGFFGLHPLLQPLLPIYQKGQLAMVHASGSPHNSRSHFEAQDFMESGVAGHKTINDGWLNRYLLNNPDPKGTSFRGIAMTKTLPRTLIGKAAALALRDVADGESASAFQATYGQMYSQETNSVISGAAKEMFSAVEALKSLKLEPPANPGLNQQQVNAVGPLRQVAQLIKANLGVEVAFVDFVTPTWDTHNNQGGAEGGALAQALRPFAQALATFYRDLGDRAEDVVVLTMSEFGRTVKENGSAGTDHGHGNVMFVMGGPVQGGKVYGQWPGLEEAQLNEQRDLAVTTDFRDVFAELLVGHLGCQKPEAVFPGYALDSKRFRNVLRKPAAATTA